MAGLDTPAAQDKRANTWFKEENLNLESSTWLRSLISLCPPHRFFKYPFGPQALAYLLSSSTGRVSQRSSINAFANPQSLPALLSDALDSFSSVFQAFGGILVHD